MYKLVINPTFKCDFDCIFCYVKKEMETYQDRLLDISVLDDVFKNYKFEEVVISGGEPTNCPYDYMISLIEKIREYYDGQIDFETNFHNPTYCEKLQNATGVNIVVGYDFHAKPYANETWVNMYDYPNKFDIKLCATHFVVKSFHPNLILKKFSLLRNFKEFEVVRYMKNFSNQWKVETELFDKFIALFANSDFENKYTMKNIKKVKDNSYLLRPLIINPDGLLYVQSFGTIVQQIPFTGEFPEITEDFATYTNNSINVLGSVK